MKYRILSLNCAAFLAGCTVGPDYIPPESATPAAWSQPLPEKPASSLPKSAWWTTFEDPLLTAYVDRALHNNLTVEGARGRVLEARAILKAARAPFWPQIDLETDASRGNAGYVANNKTVGVLEADVNASLTLDLFGGLTREIEAADATLGSLEASLEDVQVSLAGDVVTTYITYREFQHRLKAIKAQQVAAQGLLTLTRDRFKAGLVTGLDVTAAEAALEAVQSQIPPLQQALATAALSLTVLLGENPGREDGVLSALRPIPRAQAMIALEAPAATIAQRPDIRAQERQLASKTALHAAAITALYPKITLAGLLGLQSTTASRNSGIWSLGAGLTLPLLNFGLLQGQIDAADAQQAQALAAYKQTVLGALGDIETRLSAVRETAAAEAKVNAQVEALQRQVTLAQARYRTGLTSRLEALRAEEQVLRADDALLTAKANAARALAALYTSLGWGASTETA